MTPGRLQSSIERDGIRIETGSGSLIPFSAQMAAVGFDASTFGRGLSEAQPRVLELGDERAGLVIGEVERHNRMIWEAKAAWRSRNSHLARC